MSTSTTNYSLTKPAVNSATDQDLWGTELNTNLDTIDTKLKIGIDRVKRTITGADSVVAGDRKKILLCDATTAAFTLTLLAAATAADGFEFTVVKTDSTAHAVLLDGNASETIGGATTFSLSGQGDSATLVSDGSNWNFTGNKTTPSAVASASTSAQGIIQIATSAELITGTDSAKAVTCQDIKTALGFSTYYESAEQVATGGSKIALSHSLASIPKLTQFELVCKTTDLGYAVADRVPLTNFFVTSSLGFTSFFNATQVGFTIPASGMWLYRKDTGAAAAITTANWRVVARAWC